MKNYWFDAKFVHVRDPTMVAQNWQVRKTMDQSYPE